MTLATVIIPTYNYGHYIHQAIESVIAQTGLEKPAEIIVIDDGSTDGTEEIVSKYGARVRFLKQHNQGKAVATRKGIEMASGDYIFNLDADDWFYPRRIADAIQVFQAFPNVVHVSHPAQRVRRGVFQEQEPIPSRLLDKEIDGKQLLEYFFIHRIFYGGGSTYGVKASVAKSFQLNAGVDMYTDEYLVMFALQEGSSYFISYPLSVANLHGNNYSYTVSIGDRKRKHLRLFNSSSSLNEAVQAHHFTPRIKKYFQLHNQARNVNFLELEHEKKWADVKRLWFLLFQSSSILDKRFFFLFSRYKILYRSIPDGVLDWLRKRRQPNLNNAV